MIRVMITELFGFTMHHRLILAKEFNSPIWKWNYYLSLTMGCNCILVNVEFLLKPLVSEKFKKNL